MVGYETRSYLRFVMLIDLGALVALLSDTPEMADLPKLSQLLLRGDRGTGNRIKDNYE